MIKHQFIERATEVTWMLLLISVSLFTDLWLRHFHEISVMEISNDWVKSNFDISDAIGIIVLYSIFMAGVIPGIRFVLPLVIALVYGELCKRLNWDVKIENNDDLKKYFIEEEEVKQHAVSTNNSVLFNTYINHLQIKHDIIKQQTVCQSILIFGALSFLPLGQTINAIQFGIDVVNHLSWYIYVPVNAFLCCFVVFLAGIGLTSSSNLNYMRISLEEASTKDNN